MDNAANQASSVDLATLTDDQRSALTLMEEVCAASGCTRIGVRSMQGAYLYIELVGGDVRMTWGRMGQSLDALQFLCNLILSHRIGFDVRLVLDADNYRQRREEALREKAIELANEVRPAMKRQNWNPCPRMSGVSSTTSWRKTRRLVPTARATSRIAA